jgi:hypothetical protein
MRVFRAFIVAAAILVATATPASAAAEHFTDDLTGEVFSCSGHTYTLQGEISGVFLFFLDAQGRHHFTLISTTSSVTATDENGAVYNFTGAEAFHQQQTTWGTVGHLTLEHNFVARGEGSVDQIRVVEQHLSPGEPTTHFTTTCFDIV